jgi:hypothetical protein
VADQKQMEVACDPRKGSASQASQALPSTAVRRTDEEGVHVPGITGHREGAALSAARRSLIATSACAEREHRRGAGISNERHRSRRDEVRRGGVHTGVSLRFSRLG